MPGAPGYEAKSACAVCLVCYSDDSFPPGVIIGLGVTYQASFTPAWEKELGAVGMALEWLGSLRAGSLLPPTLAHAQPMPPVVRSTAERALSPWLVAGV